MSFLVNGIKAQAEGEEDADLQKRLLAAAKNLADATAKMVEAAKVRLNFTNHLQKKKLPQVNLLIIVPACGWKIPLRANLSLMCYYGVTWDI